MLSSHVIGLLSVLHLGQPQETGNEEGRGEETSREEENMEQEGRLNIQRTVTGDLGTILNKLKTSRVLSNTELEHLQENCKTGGDVCAEQVEQKNKLQSINQELREKQSHLESHKSILDSNILNLHNHVKALEKRNVELAADCQLNQEKVESCQKKFQEQLNITVELRQKNKQFRESLKSKGDAESALKTLKATVEALQQKLKASEGTASSHSANMKILSATVSNLRKKNEELVKMNTDLSDQLEASLALANKNMAEVKRLGAEHNSLQLQSRNKEGVLEFMKRQNINLKHRLKECTSQSEEVMDLSRVLTQSEVGRALIRLNSIVTGEKNPRGPARCDGKAKEDQESPLVDLMVRNTAALVNLTQTIAIRGSAPEAGINSKVEKCAASSPANTIGNGTAAAAPSEITKVAAAAHNVSAVSTTEAAGAELDTTGMVSRLANKTAGDGAVSATTEAVANAEGAITTIIAGSNSTDGDATSIVNGTPAAAAGNAPAVVNKNGTVASSAAAATIPAAANTTTSTANGSTTSNDSVPAIKSSTQPAANTTAANDALPAVNDTVPAANSSVPVANVTVPVANNTIQAANATVLVANTIAQAPNATLLANNATVPAANGTVLASNITAPPVNTNITAAEITMLNANGTSDTAVSVANGTVTANTAVSVANGTAPADTAVPAANGTAPADTAVSVANGTAPAVTAVPVANGTAPAALPTGAGNVSTLAAAAAV